MAPARDRAMDRPVETFRENVRRFKKFTDIVLNPKVLSEIINELQDLDRADHRSPH